MKYLLSAAFLAIIASGSAHAGTETSPVNRLLAGDGTTELAQSCSSGMNYCSPGSYGPGGCYNIGYATCTAGLVCTGGMKACNPGGGRAAYCYKVGYGKCQ